MSHIQYWDLESSQYRNENVYSEKFMRWLYSDSLGGRIGNLILTRKIFNWGYGLYKESALSQKEIAPFIRQASINVDEFEQKDYRSFNDFFIRRFQPGKRRFAEDPNVLPGFAEGKCLAYAGIQETTKLPVKGSILNLPRLLGGKIDHRPFLGGALFICRISLRDYHRFHFPDAGKFAETSKISGGLQSVSPIAMGKKPQLLFRNERQISLLQTKNFGRMAYVEVGAFTVGRICQTHPTSENFERGEEKGLFKIGGSTVIVVLEPGQVTPHPELLHQTTQGFETFVKLGTPIGKRSARPNPANF